MYFYPQVATKLKQRQQKRSQTAPQNYEPQKTRNKLKHSFCLSHGVSQHQIQSKTESQSKETNKTRKRTTPKETWQRQKRIDLVQYPLNDR